MKPNQAYESTYLKSDSDEIPEDGHVVVTIKRIVMETLKSDRGDENKPILYFEEFEKGMVLNRTNWNIIGSLLKSDESDDWIGQQIALYSADVQFGAEMKRGIRVKTKMPKATGAPAQPAPAKPRGNGGGWGTGGSDRPQRPARGGRVPAVGPEPLDDDEDIPFAYDDSLPYGMIEEG